MTPRRISRVNALALLAVSLATITSLPALADEPTSEWLRGSGDDLQIRLRGEVVDPDGQPAAHLEISGALNLNNAAYPLNAAKVDGHRFEIWIPVNQARWHAMWLRAASGERVAYKKLGAYELRQAAIDGVKLQLQSPTRTVAVKVTHDGKPAPHALVQADVGWGIELRSRADADGVVQFGLLADQQLSSLSAWTDDFLVGGYSFSRKPTRDPAANEHVIELSNCRDQELRFVDEAGSPVAGVEFTLSIATPPPDYNYIGTNEHSRLTTDAQGEAIHPWFPDWKEHHFYPEVHSSGWVLDGEPETVDDAIVFKLKPAKARKRIEGRVVSADAGVGGFYVTLESFQAEREHHVDRLTAYTSADGSFALEVLPDATYCGYVLDSRWVGKLMDVIPYSSQSDRATPPELAVHQGQPVEVTVTTGPQQKPYANLTVSFRRYHDFTWRENGEKRSGTGGPQWWATTDDAGRATTWTLPGKLEVSVYTPLWRTQEEIEVRAGEPVKVSLHREFDEKRPVAGRLVLADGVEASLAGAQIKFGAVDGNYDDQRTIPVEGDGSFAFKTQAAKIGVFAYTADGAAAGSVVTEKFDKPIEVTLRPTLDYHGQLLGDDDKPLANHGVRAIVRVEGDEDYDGMFVKSFEAKRIETATDEQGNFTLRGLPSEMKAVVYADAIDGSEYDARIAEIFLDPQESRPRTVSRLTKPKTRAASPRSVRDEFETALRDARLAGYRLLVLLSHGDKDALEFIDRNFADHDVNEDVYDFMRVVITSEPDRSGADDQEFLEQQDWQLPEQGRLTAYALDAGGNELARLDLDVTDREAADRTAQFIHEHAPPRLDAEAKWDEAFAEARSSNRRVWVRLSGRYCGPCFRLSRWLDDQRDTLAADYVMLKVDSFRDLNGRDVAERLTHGKHHGIPFHGIFAADETLLIDSAGPLGNIGHPSSFEGQKHLRKMLTDTRQHLTDAEIDELVESLDD